MVERDLFKVTDKWVYFEVSGLGSDARPWLCYGGGILEDKVDTNVSFSEFSKVIYAGDRCAITIIDNISAIRLAEPEDFESFIKKYPKYTNVVPELILKLEK